MEISIELVKDLRQRTGAGIVDCKAALQEFVKNMAMHIAAANPQFIRREDVPPDVLEKEKDIYRTQALDSGKPAKVIDKIVEGKLERIYSETRLLEQTYIT